MGQMSYNLEEIVEEILAAAPNGKQVPPLRFFQEEAARKLGYAPGLDTIRKLLNQRGYHTDGKRSHRWTYQHNPGKGE